MKIRIFNKTAFTLIELIIALILVSVVVLGVFSINNVLTNSNQDYGQRYLVKSDTQTTLNHILNNAALAWSNPTNDPVVVTGVGAGGNTFCIHQPPASNLISNVNDIWLCYQWYPSTDPTYPYQIKWCAETYVNGAATSCSTAANLLSGPTYLGSAYSVAPLYGAVQQKSFNSLPTYPLSNPVVLISAADLSTLMTYLGPSGHAYIDANGNVTSTFLGLSGYSSMPSTNGNTPTIDGNLQQIYNILKQSFSLFSITIQNCLNNATPPGTCNMGAQPGTSSDPVNNPEMQLSGSVILSQASSS